MRRLQAVFIGMLLLLAMAVPVAAAENPIRIFLGGTEVSYDAAPFVESGRTLVPLRGLSESMGFQVDFHDGEQRITMTRGSTQIILWIGSTRVLVNGEEFTLDVPAKVVNQRTFVPLRFLSERLGASVVYDAAANAVRVTPDAALNQLRAMYAVSEADAAANTKVTSAFTYSVDMHMFGMVTSMEMPMEMVTHSHGGNVLMSYSMSLPVPLMPPMESTTAIRDGVVYGYVAEMDQWFIMGEFDPNNPQDMGAISGDADFMAGFGAGLQLATLLGTDSLTNVNATFGASQVVDGVEAVRIDVAYPASLIETVFTQLAGPMGMESLFGSDVQIKSGKLSESHWIHPTTARLLKSEVSLEMEFLINDPAMGPATMVIRGQGGSSVNYNPGPIQWPAGLDQAEVFPTFDWDF